jgi:predicted  nucleic acid-binding Zn-ribbon protein
MQRKVAELEEELSRLDVKYQEKITGIYAEEQEKVAQERSRSYTSQKEVEALKRELEDIVEEKDRLISKLSRQLEDIKKEVDNLQGERFDNKNRLANTGRDFQKLEQDIDGKTYNRFFTEWVGKGLE